MFTRLCCLILILIVVITGKMIPHLFRKQSIIAPEPSQLTLSFLNSQIPRLSADFTPQVIVFAQSVARR